MRTIATLFAALAIAIGGVGIANAAPDTGSTGAAIEPVGTGSTGAALDPIGTGGPDYTKPEPKPVRSNYENADDYRMAVALWEAGERGRVANLEITRKR